MTVFALWSAPRARSTAFFRSMLERGDLVCVHEPFSDLAGLGETDADGWPFTTEASFLAWLHGRPDGRPVFLKDTTGRRHDAVLGDERLLAAGRHAFLIRRPEEIAASSYAVEPRMGVAAIGLELLHELHAAVSAAGGHPPVVIDADDLVADAAATMAAYCAAVGLPFRPDALSWEAGHRPEWRRSARWHVAVAASTGFAPPNRADARPLAPALARMAAHHRPSYEALSAQKLDIGPFRST